MNTRRSYKFSVVSIIGLLALSTIADTSFQLLVDLARDRYGLAAAERVDAWRTLIDELKDKNTEQQLRATNDFINKNVRFMDDKDIWNLSDYWATPLETLGRMQGDCEDFTIAKYYTLKSLGVPIEKLRMTYVQAQIGGVHSKLFQAHMVLAYYAEPAADPIILDNLIDDLRPGSRRADLVPVFSFNDEGLWVSGSSEKVSEPEARLSTLRDLLARMRAEGFIQ
ncbi:transglutaminase-like cysteine peptidase [Aurantivibrio infirmus]